MKLRTRFLIVISLLYIIVGAGSIYIFYSSTDSVIEGFAARFASKEAQIQKNRVLTLIDSEIILARRMADDYLIQRWVLDENNEEARRAAFIQIEGYRKLAKDRESFLTVASSQRYYTFTGQAPIVVTLKQGVPENRWFFDTMEKVETYDLNTDANLLLQRTKVWINTIMRGPDGSKIAVVGSGVNISVILEEIISNQDPGISVYLVDEKGIIQACDDRKIVVHNAKALDQDKISIYSILKESGSEGDLSSAIQSFHEENQADGERKSRQSVVTFPFHLDGRMQVAAVSYMQHLGWYNVVLVDTGRVISALDFLPILAGFFLSLLVLAVLLGYLIHRLILAPLEQLTVASSKMAGGHYDVNLDVKRSDEIGKLTETFNAMAGTVREYTTGLEEKVQERTRQLSITNEALTKSQHAIDESIQYASIIQSSILPDASLFEACFSEHLLIHKPKLTVGGDFHYLRRDDDSVIVAAVDCTGHGVPGAFMTMTAASALNHIVDSSREIDPARILSELNRRMKETLRFREIDAGLDISLCTIDTRARKIRFAGAGLSLFQYTDREVIEYRGDMQRIGYRSSGTDFKYRTHPVEIRPDDTFYLTTDGILDEPGGERGYGFGAGRFRKMLQENGDRPLSEQIKVFREILVNFRGSFEQRDDQTMIGFRL